MTCNLNHHTVVSKTTIVRSCVPPWGVLYWFISVPDDPHQCFAILKFFLPVFKFALNLSVVISHPHLKRRWGHWTQYKDVCNCKLVKDRSSPWSSKLLHPLLSSDIHLPQDGFWDHFVKSTIPHCLPAPIHHHPLQGVFLLVSWN